jgi:hypothetical protein
MGRKSHFTGAEDQLATIPTTISRSGLSHSQFLALDDNFRLKDGNEMLCQLSQEPRVIDENQGPFPLMPHRRGP